MGTHPTVTATATDQDKSENKQPQTALQNFDPKRFEQLTNARDYDTNQWYKQRTSRWNAEIISSPLHRRRRRHLTNPKKTFTSSTRSSTSAARLLEDAHDIPTTFTKDNHFHFEEVLQKLESYNRTLTRTASLTSHKNKKKEQDKNTQLEKKHKDPYVIVRNFENYKQSVQQEQQQSEQEQKQSGQPKPILQVPTTYRRQRTSPSLLEHADTKDLLGELSLLARRHSAPLDEYDVNGNVDADDDTTFSSLSIKNPFFTKSQYHDDDAGYYPSNVSSPPNTSSADKNKTPRTTAHDELQPQQTSSSWFFPSWKSKRSLQGEHQDNKRDNLSNSHNDIHSKTPLTVQETPESMNGYNNNNKRYSDHNRDGHDKNLSGMLLFGNDDEYSLQKDTLLAKDDSGNPNNNDNYLLQLSQLMFGYDHDVVRRYQTTHTNHHDTHGVIHEDDDDEGTLLEKQATTILEEEEEDEVSITNSTISSLEDNTTNVNVATVRRHRRRHHSDARQPKEQGLLVLVQQHRTRRRTWICILLLVVSNTVLFTMLKHDQIDKTSLPFVMTKYTTPKTTMMQKYYNKYIRNNAWRKNLIDQQYHQFLLQQSQRLAVDPFSKILHQTKTNLHLRIKWQLWQQKVFHWIQQQQQQQTHNWTTMTHTFVLPHTRYLYRYFHLFQSKDNMTMKDNDNTLHNEQEEPDNVVSNFAMENKDENDNVVNNKDDKDSTTKPHHHHQQNIVVDEQPDKQNSQESSRLFSAHKKKNASHRIPPSWNDNDGVNNRVVANVSPQVASAKENSHVNAATLGSSSSSSTRTKKESDDVDSSKTPPTTGKVISPPLKENNNEESSSFITGDTVKATTTAEENSKILSKTKDHVKTTSKAKPTQIPVGSTSNKKRENKQEMDQKFSTSSSPAVSSNTAKTSGTITKGAGPNLTNQTTAQVEKAAHQMPQSNHDDSGDDQEVHHDDDSMPSKESESAESILATSKSDEPPEPSTTKDSTKQAQNLVSTRQTATKEKMTEVNTNNDDSSTSTMIKTKESSPFQQERAHDIDRQSTDELERRQGAQPSAIQKSLHSDSLPKNLPIRVIRPMNIGKESYNKAEKPISIANLVRFGSDIQSDLMQSIQERMDHIGSKIFSSSGPGTLALPTKRVTHRSQVSKPLANFVSTSHNLQIGTTSRRSGSDELLLRYMQLIAFQLACFHADMNPNISAYVGGVYCKSIFKRCKQQAYNQEVRVGNRPKSTAPMLRWFMTENIMNAPQDDKDEDAFLQVPLIEIVGDWFKERRRKKQMKKKSSKHRKHR